MLFKTNKIRISIIFCFIVLILIGGWFIGFKARDKKQKIFLQDKEINKPASTSKNQQENLRAWEEQHPASFWSLLENDYQSFNLQKEAGIINLQDDIPLEGYPYFLKEAIVFPKRVSLQGGEIFFSIWAQDHPGEGIEKVQVLLDLPSGREVVDLELASGINIRGRWEGSWLAQGLKPGKIPLTFRAVNQRGEEVELKAALEVLGKEQ